MTMKNKLEKCGNDHYMFMCPGCKDYHVIAARGPQAWKWNESMDKPTFYPSYLTWYESKGRPHERASFRCHSWITDGKIQFLDDCSHELKNQTVELPDAEE